eukprot:gene49327-63765_t
MWWYGAKGAFRNSLATALLECGQAAAMFSAMPLCVWLSGGTNGVLRKLPTCLGVVVCVGGGLSTALLGLRLTSHIGKAAMLQYLRGARLVGNATAGMWIYCALTDNYLVAQDPKLFILPPMVYTFIIQMAAQYPSPDRTASPQELMARQGFMGMAASVTYFMSNPLAHTVGVLCMQKMFVFLCYAAWFGTFQTEWDYNIVPAAVRSATYVRLKRLSDDPRQRCFY